MSVREFSQAEEGLKGISEKDLKEKIEREHNNMVNHAKQVRLDARKGKEAQAIIEEGEAKKYRCVKIKGMWVQTFPDWKVPSKIINFLTKKNMTAISGIIDKKNKKTYLASDQMGSNGFTGQNYKTPKLFKKNTISVAFCGSYRLGQILRHNFKPRNFQEKESVDDYVFDYLDTEFRKTLKEREYLKETDGTQSVEKAEVIFAIKDRLFLLQGDLSILEAESIYITSGSGVFHQEASIHTQLKMDKNKNYKKILKDAIEYTSEVVLSVGGSPKIIEHNH